MTAAKPANGRQVGRGGKPVAPPSDPPPALFAPSIYARAFAYHRAHTGCDCDDSFPCQACATEIGALMSLLDAVARDAIAITARTFERFRG